MELAHADNQRVARPWWEQRAGVTYEPKADKGRCGNDQLDGRNEDQAERQAEVFLQREGSLPSCAIAVGAMKWLEVGVDHGPGSCR